MGTEIEELLQQHSWKEIEIAEKVLILVAAFFRR
jgi:hypothetical protein